MVALCNKAIVLDQIDFADTAAVRASLGRVHAYVNIGLEYLSHHDPQQLVLLLTTRALQSLCQIGFSLSMRLRQRASSLQAYLNGAAGVRRALPGLARSVIDGLLQTWHPQFCVGPSLQESWGIVTFCTCRTFIWSLLFSSPLSTIQLIAWAIRRPEGPMPAHLRRRL